MHALMMIAALLSGSLHAVELSTRTQVLDWLATQSLRPGDEVPSYSEGGPFTFRDADADSMTFTYPVRGKVAEFALQKLGHDLRDAGFAKLRRLLIRNGGPRRELFDIYDLSLGRSYRVTNRSLEDLRNRSYLNGELNEANLRQLGGRVLDLGCGSRARTVLSLREAGLDAYGVDPGAEEDLRGEFIRAESGAQTSFASASMRRIFSSYSVFLYSEEQTSELRANLAECDRLLEPGGQLVIAGALGTDHLKDLVKERRRLMWEDSYRNEEIFGPTVVIRKR